MEMLEADKIKGEKPQVETNSNQIVNHATLGLKIQASDSSSRVSSDTEATDNSQEFYSPMNSSDEEEEYDSDFEDELRKFEQRLNNIESHKLRLNPNVSDEWIRKLQKV